MPSFFHAFLAPVVLFNAALSTPPGEQGWITLAEPVEAQVTEAVGPEGTRLDTLAKTEDKAGYFGKVPPLALKHPLAPVLDRAKGYAVQWEAALSAERHINKDRAGFSVIVLSHDRKGVEIGMWENEVWVQADAPLFTHGEGVSHDTKRMTRYRLEVQGDAYRLAIDGKPALAGKLRDYSSFGQPYDWPDFLFFGDDTSSASADVTIRSFVVESPRIYAR